MMEGQFRVQMTRSHAGPEAGIAENPWPAAIGWWSVRQGSAVAFCVVSMLLSGVEACSVPGNGACRRPSGDRFGGGGASCFFFRLFSFWSRFAGTRLIRGSCPWQDAASRRESELRSFSEPNFVRRWWLFRCHWWGIECFISKMGLETKREPRDGLSCKMATFWSTSIFWGILWRRGNAPGAASR